MKLLDHIQNLRKAQLQEFFVRWFPTEKMTSDREQLVERLAAAMCDPKTIRDRFDRVQRSGQDFLVSLLTLPERRGDMAAIRSVPRGRTIEPYEVESLVKNLANEGWIIALSEASNGVRVEVYVLPEEIAAGLGATVDVEYREAPAMLSLKDFLAAVENGGGKPRRAAPALDELIEPEAIRGRIEKLVDDKLRAVVEEAIEHHGGILTLTRWRGDSEHGEPDGQLHRPAWRQALESGWLGTTGVLSLKSFGIDLEEECLVVFQEVVEAFWREKLVSTRELEREFSLGIDLLIDIRRLLEIARSETLEVTREGTVFRKTEERILSELLSNNYRELFEGSPIPHLIGLCKKLKLLDQGDHYLRTDPLRRKVWLKKRLPSMVRGVFELYQREYRGARWSFHQRVLREIFLDEFLGLPSPQWTDTRALFTVSVARYLGSLRELDVAKTFRDLQVEEFHHETLMVPGDRLYQDLSYWVIHRLAVVGLIDLGWSEGIFHAMRISTLGSRFFKLESPVKERARVVMNPDFELLLFPGEKIEAELSYAIGTFADRTASDRVKRFRITPESIKRGIIAGFDSASLIKFLEKHSDNDLPPNVRYSIHEWADGIEPVLRQRVLLLKTQSGRGADQICGLLTDHEIPHERVGEQSVVVRGVRNERRIRELQETFQNAGLILE